MLIKLNNINKRCLNLNERDRERCISISISMSGGGCSPLTAGNQAWSVVSGGSELEKTVVCVFVYISVFCVRRIHFCASDCVFMWALWSALSAFYVMSVYCTFLRQLPPCLGFWALLNEADSLCGHWWLITPQENDNTIAALSKCRYNTRNTHLISIGND